VHPLWSYRGRPTRHGWQFTADDGWHVEIYASDLATTPRGAEALATSAVHGRPPQVLRYMRAWWDDNPLSIEVRLDYLPYQTTTEVHHAIGGLEQGPTLADVRTAWRRSLQLYAFPSQLTQLLRRGRPPDYGPDDHERFREDVRHEIRLLLEENIRARISVQRIADRLGYDRKTIGDYCDQFHVDLRAEATDIKGELWRAAT